jgi:hypothetical protein
MIVKLFVLDPENENIKNWKRLSKNKVDNTIIRIFENKITKEKINVITKNDVFIGFEQNVNKNIVTKFDVHPNTLPFSFCVIDGNQTLGVYNDSQFIVFVDIGIVKERDGVEDEDGEEIGAIHEDNLCSHVPEINFVLKHLGINYEEMENMFCGEKDGKNINEITKTISSFGWIEDKQIGKDWCEDCGYIWKD